MFGFLPVSSTNLPFQSKLFNTVKWKVDHDLSKVRSLSIRGIQVFLRIRRIYEHCLAIQGREHVCSMSGQIKTSLPKRQHPRVLSYDACALQRTCLESSRNTIRTRLRNPSPRVYCQHGSEYRATRYLLGISRYNNDINL